MARTRAACLGIAVTLCGLFIVAVARLYHPGYGFTALVGFPEDSGDQLPALRGVPHVTYRGAGVYDGQFYAQRALDPLIRDPLADRAMDLAPYRARRILFSWTAYALGLGRPAWIIEAYALQNVACWLILAWLLTRWLPPTSPRHLALWAACLFSHGLLWSVRFSLLDGPSLLLIAVAVAAAERGQTLVSAAIGGVAALGRETNVLAILAQPLPRTPRAAGRLILAGILLVLPLLVWEDYLRSIYRSTIAAGADQLTLPGQAYWSNLQIAITRVAGDGVWSFAAVELCIFVALTAQAAYVLARRDHTTAWWRVAAGYVVLMLLMDRVLWDPGTGAVTRVLLPLTVGANILLASERRGQRFWPWFALMNLHLVPALWVMPLL